MEMGSTQRYDLQDSISVTIGNITYIVEHVFGGDRNLQELMTDFMEQRLRELED